MSDSDDEHRTSLMGDLSDDGEVEMSGDIRDDRFAPGMLVTEFPGDDRENQRGCCGLRPPASTRAGYFALIFVPLVIILVVIGFVTANVPPAADVPPAPETGLSPRPAEGSDAAKREALFLKSVLPTSVEAHLRELASKPHIAGSARDLETAQYVKDELDRLGYTTENVDHDVLLGQVTPTARRSLVARGAISNQFTSTPGSYVARLREGGTGAGLGALPPFNGFSKSGNLKNKCVVYVNYGRASDFALLNQSGVDLTDCVGLARYGKIFRGNKAKLCQEYGCSGILIYSDPEDDGCRRGAVVPEGPWRNSESAQRGSVWTGNGDPLTPGWPSTADAPRITTAQAFDPVITGYDPLPEIPVMPLTWRDAIPLMSALCSSGNAVPASWVGGLPTQLGLTGECDANTPRLNYCFGGHGANLTVDYEIEMDTRRRKIRNVIGVMHGHSERAIVFGNHRDGTCSRGGISRCPPQISPCTFALVSLFALPPLTLCFQPGRSVPSTRRVAQQACSPSQRLCRRSLRRTRGGNLHAPSFSRRGTPKKLV
jgi:hypothetical protein